MTTDYSEVPGQEEKLSPQEVWKILNNKTAVTADSASNSVWNYGSTWSFKSAPTLVLSADTIAPVLEEPQPPGPTCKWFTPSETMEQEYGSIRPDDWPYDKLMKYAACSNPGFNEMGKFACEMVLNQTSCVAYETTTSVIISRKRLRRKSDESRKYLAVERSYVGISLPKYEITTADNYPAEPGTEQLCHVVDGTQHGKQTKEVVDNLVDLTIKDFDADAMVTEVKLPVPDPPPSYLKTLVTV